MGPRIIVVALGASGCLVTWSPCSSDDGNLVTGGSFDSLQCWEDRYDSWRDRVSVEFTGATLDVNALSVEGGGGGDIVLTQQGGNAMMRDTLFVYEGLSLELSVTAGVFEGSRPFRITLQDAEDPGVELGALEGAANGTDQRFSTTWTAERDQDLILEIVIPPPHEDALDLDHLRFVPLDEE